MIWVDKIVLHFERALKAMKAMSDQQDIISFPLLGNYGNS